MVASLLLLAACGPDAEDPAVPSHLLQAEDLPAVETVEVRDGHSASKTDCGAMDLEYNVAVTKGDPAYARYALESGDSVVTTTQGPSTGQPSIDYTITRVDGAIDECVKRARTRPDAPFERLEGLPEGAIGFRSVAQTSAGPETTDRAYGPVTDREVAVVTVKHLGDGEPTVSVAELLAKALDRAR